MPRVRATTRWRGRASIPTSLYRGRPDGWASWRASPRSKRSSATTRRSPKTRPRSTRCARTTSISSTPESPPPAGSWTRSSCQKKRARRWRFSSRRRANSPAHTSEPSCCRVNHEITPHPAPARRAHRPMQWLRSAAGHATTPATSPASPASPAPTSPPPTATGVASRLPILPPARALLVGLMPLQSAGVNDFRAKHPAYDGRGVVIGILDTGVDPGVDGLIVTSTGAPKLLDVRDFSGEGVVRLTPVTPTGDGTVAVAGRALAGAGRIGRLTTATSWYAGVLAERPLGKVPGADQNGDGTNSDAFPVIVVKATDGWVAFIDTNLDGSFEDEMPLHDYRQGRETIALGTKPITLAANFGESSGVPTLAFVFDNNAHGTHVAGIAAGHTLFNVAGFDGVAPGAQLLGLKIANDARGGISVNGAMQRAMQYAARYAEQRHLPLVLNLSFGVGNELEGQAVIDSIVDAFLVAHPAVVFTISAGNDGPGLSTVGFPGSADLAVSVGAAFPGAFARPAQPGTPTAADVMGWWSSRGGELAKPDLVTPGVAFSSVPRWRSE